MRKYTSQAASRMKWTHFYYPHGAMLDRFEEFMHIWGQFDALWRRSYGPPIENKDLLAIMVADMAEIQRECKALYSRLKVDPTGIEGITRFPPVNTIVHKSPTLKSSKKPLSRPKKAKKGGNTSPKKGKKQ